MILTRDLRIAKLALYNAQSIHGGPQKTERGTSQNIVINVLCPSDRVSFQMNNDTKNSQFGRVVFVLERCQ